ncbi:MAG: hypothetical protein EXS05_15150 [Planctomycetaceae bacterium]|nr:hypothetical protein [Planctomycetaceae bacterium]
MNHNCRPVLILCALLSGLAVASAQGADPAVRFTRVPSEGLQPQVAVDAEGVAHLLYFRGEAGDGDVFYVRRDATGDRWTEPLQVNSQAGSAIAVGSIRGAQLALGKGGRIHVAWNGSNQAQPRGPGKYDSPMLYSRLNDKGDAFEGQRNLMENMEALDGGGSVAADTEGNVYVVWHAGTGGEINRRVWLARSTDEGLTFSSATAVDAEKLGACGCCGLKAFADREGALYVLYRSARENVNRDMQLLVSPAKGRSFLNQQLDAWKVATCPMSSEAFAEGPDALYAAWETNGQVSFARIDSERRTAAAGTAAPGQGTGRKHPALAVNKDGRVLLVWTEGTGWQKGGSLAWQEFDAKGKPTRVRGRKEGIAVWSFAAAYAETDGTFVIVY